MKIADLSGKSVCLLGFGREGQAMLKTMQQFVRNASITIADSNEKCLVPAGLTAQLGKVYLHDLNRFDVIIKTPGIPPRPELEAVRQKLTSSTQIFLDSIQNSGAIVIGITGSKGKSTTSTLIHELLKADGKDAHLIGNIGKPSIEYIDAARQGTFFVMEMSSYQLMDLTVSPQIAVVTSLFPEHLDYHGSFSAYLEAKAHLARFQSARDVIFYNLKSEGARQIASESHGRKMPFCDTDAPLRIDETKLLGQHNLSNIGAAYKVAEYLGVSKTTCLAVFKSFNGLPHRLQSLGVHHGIEWVDDAISTTPESTIAGLKALGNRVSTVILGGQDRGNDFTELAKYIARSGCIRHAILIGQSGPRIKQALLAENVNLKLYSADTMTKIIQTALAANQPPSLPPPIVVLSTASPSYDMFKNFEEKGDLFAMTIKLINQ